MPSTWLEDLASRWVPGTGPVDVRPLGSGSVNRSFRVKRAGQHYAMRLAAADEDATALGLDRRWECAVLEVVAAMGLAPGIAQCDPDHGILVVRWLKGGAWSAAQTRQPHATEALTRLLRAVHRAPTPRPARVMSPAAWIAHYRAACELRGLSGGASMSLRLAADAWLGASGALEPRAPVLCHGDLHRLNVLVGERRPEGERLWLLDWEYAHVSDAMWDLAGWIENTDADDAVALQVLEGYLERRARRAEWEHLRALRWLYGYVCVLWSELYLTRGGGRVVPEVAARLDVLLNRLGYTPSGRAGQLPAH